MKQRILLLIMIGCLTKAYSQDKKSSFHLSFGPTLSIPKVSEMSDSDLEGSPEIKSSINIGAFILPTLNYPLNAHSSVDGGVGFYLDRFSIEDVLGVVTSRGRRNISQIQVPINFNFNFSKDKSYQFGIGGFTSFLLSAREKGETTASYSQLDDQHDPSFREDIIVRYDNNIKDNYNSVSFGAFTQLKKSISFSSDKKGFILLRINQYFNSIKNKSGGSDSNHPMIVKVYSKNEKEPTTVNIGIGMTF